MCAACLQVRKVTAEAMYVRMLTLEDAFTGEAVEGMLGLLSTTAWAGRIAACCVARDSMYPMLQLVPPAARMGLGAVDAAGGHSRGSQSHGGPGFDSYEALVQETGY